MIFKSTLTHRLCVCASVNERFWLINLRQPGSTFSRYWHVPVWFEADISAGEQTRGYVCVCVCVVLLSAYTGTTWKFAHANRPADLAARWAKPSQTKCMMNKHQWVIDTQDKDGRTVIISHSTKTKAQCTRIRAPPFYTDDIIWNQSAQ